jgi:hypothetical protein
MGLTSNPFTPWLVCLRRPDEKAPKHITDYQFYMQHQDYKDAVSARFNAESWDVPRADKLARRCEIAREMFQTEPEDVKQRIQQEAREEHEDELRRWKDADEGLPSIDAAEQDEYVRRTCVF